MPSGSAELKIDVKGLRRLQSALDRIERELPGEAKAALQEAANLVASDVKRTGPRGPSGRLLASVRTEVLTLGALSRHEASVVVDARRVSRAYPSGYLYPRRVEYSSRPFLRPAFSRQLSAMGDLMEKRILEGAVADKWAGS